MRSILAMTLVLLMARVADAGPWGADVSSGWTSDGIHVAVNTRYRWTSNELTVGLRAFPPGLRDAWPVGGQVGYRHRFRGRFLRPLVGPEYQLTRHRGGAWHSLFWSYGIEVPIQYGVAFEHSIGLGAAYLHQPRVRTLVPDALMRAAVVYRFGSQP